jgi:hypothetical protein
MRSCNTEVAVIGEVGARSGRRRTRPLRPTRAAHRQCAPRSRVVAATGGGVLFRIFFYRWMQAWLGVQVLAQKTDGRGGQGGDPGGSLAA